MATRYGQRPSTWVLTPAQLERPENQAFALDFDQTIFAMGSAFDAEQATNAEQLRKFREASR
jgi:hypothetical protein